MNFALLGGDRSLLPLVRALEADGDHTLRFAALVPESFAADLLRAAPSVRIETKWEGLLHAAEIDAVIATASDMAEETAIKQLAAAGIPLLLSPCGDPTSTLAYELTLARDDTQVPLLPLFPASQIEAFIGLRNALREDRLGKRLDVQMSRSLPTEKGRIPLKNLHAALIHDADLLRQLGGDYNQVTAVYVGDRNIGLSRATVTLAGHGLPTAMWTITPATGGDAFELAITAERGRVVVRGELAAGEIPAVDSRQPQISGDDETMTLLENRGRSDVPAAIVTHFAAAIEGDDAPSNWTDLMRATEIVEAAERSVRRRRTIDLHFETTSERNQFKTQMTAIGCGLLSMTLMSVVFLLIAGKLFNLHPLVMKIARIGIFVPLGIFLLLQLLLFVSRPSSESKEQAARKDA